MKNFVDLAKFRADAEAAVGTIAEAAGIERPTVHIRVEEAELDKPRHIVVELREHLVDEFALRVEHWAEHGN